MEAPSEDYNAPIYRTKVFFFTLLGYLAVLHLTKFSESYVGSLAADLTFAGIVTVFFIRDRQSLTPLLIPATLNYKLLFLLLGGLTAFAFVVTHFAGFLNENLFHVRPAGYYDLYRGATFPLLQCIVFTAVFPALFEEMAFRGILFNELGQIVPAGATIIITAMLFTVLHFSFISFLWIFPIGLLFGYLRSKYNTLAYGVAGHFVYNTGIVLFEYFNL
jgi:membrane protease YdiL (CAAX protease family)